MKLRLKQKINKVKDFYRMYTTGLSPDEIERLLKKDALEAYEYFKDKTTLQEKSLETKSFQSTMSVIKEIFLSFLMQLTPARRLFYGISVVIFVFGFLWTKWLWIFSAFVILNLLLALELANKLTTRDELEIAREIQISLQPQNLPEIPWLSISSFSKPAKIVGGDFFNIVKRKDDQIASILGDVSGKGIPAALYAAHVQSMFESMSNQSASPVDIMNEMNRLICKRLRDGDFITAVIAFFESGQNAMTIARAGHNWPLYYNAKTQAIYSLKPPGMCLGIGMEMGFSACLREQTIPVYSGDILLLYSDGVTEAMNAHHHLFDLPRLESALKESAHFPVEKIVAGINRRLDEFIQTEEPHDDITMVAIKVK